MWAEHREHIDSPDLIDNCPYCYLPIQEALTHCRGCGQNVPYSHRCYIDFVPLGPIFLN